MKISCKDFAPWTHPTFGTAGCYGCANADIGMDLVWCVSSHWSMPMLVPVMEANSDSFSCSEYEPDLEDGKSLCDTCLLMEDKRCKKGKEIREIVVRFD